jgi:hypothetical protein
MGAGWELFSMKYFLRAHRVPQAFMCSAVVALLAWGLAGNVLPLPQLMQGRARPVELELLLATASAPIAAYMFGGVTLRLELLSRRTLWAPDLVLGVGALAPACLVAILATLGGETAFALALVRNTAMFVGIALALLALAGESAAIIVPVSYFLLVGTFGVTATGSPYWWAALRGPADPKSTAAALGVTVVGLLVFHIRGRHRSVVGGSPTVGP